LIFLIGTVPGKPGTWAEIKDSVFKVLENEKYLNHPTFVEEDGKEYAS